LYLREFDKLSVSRFFCLALRYNAFINLSFLVHTRKALKIVIRNKCKTDWTIRHEGWVVLYTSECKMPRQIWGARKKTEFNSLVSH